MTNPGTYAASNAGVANFNLAAVSSRPRQSHKLHAAGRASLMESEDRIVMGILNEAALGDGDTLVQVWTDNPTFSMGELTLPTVKAKIDDLRAKDKLVDDARTDLYGAR